MLRKKGLNIDLCWKSTATRKTLFGDRKRKEKPPGDSIVQPTAACVSLYGSILMLIETRSAVGRPIMSDARTINNIADTGGRLMW